jgi:hypothetical protein
MKITDPNLRSMVGKGGGWVSNWACQLRGIFVRLDVQYCKAFTQQDKLAHGTIKEINRIENLSRSIGKK